MNNLLVLLSPLDRKLGKERPSAERRTLLFDSKEPSSIC